MAARASEQTRAIQEKFESDYLRTAAEPFIGTTSPANVNGFPHFFVSDQSNNIFDLRYFVLMRLSFDKANVPTSGRVAIVDPVVEATLNLKVSITNDVTSFAENIMRNGLANGQRFISNWFGWDVLTSNRLYVGPANDGTTSIGEGVYNIFMSVLDDQTKPIMGAWRRQPRA